MTEPRTICKDSMCANMESCQHPQACKAQPMETATCPAHGGEYHWTADCPECIREARKRCVSLDYYQRALRPTPAPVPSTSVPAPAQHCQNGRADICRASQRDGIVCPADSCDIDDGTRPPDGVGVPAPAQNTCAECHGMGELQFQGGTEPCLTCNGAGVAPNGSQTKGGQTP